MPTRQINSQSDEPVPVKFAGRWIVWNSDHSQIVADGESLPELWQFVQDRGIVAPIYEKVPRADVRFVGMR